MPLLNATERQHMLNLFGVLFPYRCDGCRQGIREVLSPYKAAAGSRTFCKTCEGRAKPGDTIEFTPNIEHKMFVLLGKPNDPHRPELWTHCSDCNVELRPSVNDLLCSYVVSEGKVKKAVCKSCYKAKYDHHVAKVSASRQKAEVKGDVSRYEKLVLSTIEKDSKKKWDVGVLFEVLDGESKPHIRQAVRNLLANGKLVRKDHKLKVT